MASFHYNPFSNESSLSQWKGYLQQREYSNDIKSAIKSQTRMYRDEFQRASSVVSSAIGDLNTSIDDASRRQAESIAQAAVVIVGTLDAGFDELSSKLSDVNASVERVGARLEQFGIMLDWRLSLMIDQQRISNLLLENIALLMRIPDVQKERQYHIEQGFKHYKNAALDPDFYQDAIENLLEAEKREKADYIVLNCLGMIYLYALKFIDLAKAEEYLRKAAKYAAVESDPRAGRVFNILSSRVNQELADQSISTKSIKNFAAASYLQAGRACYAQGKFADAVELSGKAFSVAPSMLEAGFMKAKALAASGDETQAASVIEGVIKSERFYAIKTAADGDLATKSRVQALLSHLRDHAMSKASEKIIACKEKMLANSQAAPLLLDLEQLLRRNTYLDALSVLDRLTSKRNWELPLFAKQYKEVIKTQTLAKQLANSPDPLQRREYKRLMRQPDSEIRRTLRLPRFGAMSIKEFISFEIALEQLEEQEAARQVEVKQKLEEVRREAEERKRQEAKERAQSEARQEHIKRLLEEAHAEYERQNRKWFGKNFSAALILYDQAANLGSEEAKRQIVEIEARIK